MSETKYYVAISEADIRDEATEDFYKVFTSEKDAAANCFDNGNGPDAFVMFELVPIADYETEDNPKLVRTAK